MKLETRKFNVATNAERFQYTVDMNAVLFDALINKTYTNKIGAVIRELSANAVDAHIEAKNKNSYEIHLPNALEPNFYIRDYGTGLTPEEIRNLYTRLGASSKRESNNTIGAYGVGSKSTFAYTNSFTIVSYKDGLKHTYQAFINNDNMPEVAVFEENSKTTEPNGLKVEFLVESQDFIKFVKEIQQCEFLSIQPKITGQNVSIKKTEYEYITTTYGVRKLDRVPQYTWSTPNYELRIIMGGIKYSYKNQGLHWIENYGLDLYFDIGQIGIANNREEIEYTSHNLRLIKERLLEVEKEIESKLQKELNNCKNWYEACKKYKNSWIYQKFNLSFNGKKLVSSKIIHSYNTQLINGRILQFLSYGRRRDSNDGHSIEIDFDDFFVENDLKVGAISRCQEIRSKKPILFFFEDGDKDIIKKELDIDNSYFTLASDLDAPTRSGRNTVKGGTYLFNGDRTFLYQSWTEQAVPDGAYYVVLRRQKPFWKGKKFSRKTISYIKELLNIDDVYGINQSVLSKVKKKVKNLKSLFDEFDGYSTFDYKTNVSRLDYHEKQNLNNFKNIKNKWIEKYVKSLEVRQDKCKKIEKAKMLAYLETDFNIDYTKDKEEDSYEILKIIKDKYPLIQSQLNSYTISKSEQQHIQKYLNCIGE